MKKDKIYLVFQLERNSTMFFFIKKGEFLLKKYKTALDLTDLKI